MKKNLFFAALAITALVSCSESDYLGEERQVPVSSGDLRAISFGSGYKAVTRAEFEGKQAADSLRNNFVVIGVKSDGTINAVACDTVFDHYNVNYLDGSKLTTTSNSAGWEYVGQPREGAYVKYGPTGDQSIKYWDYAKSQYDFIAWSKGGATAVYTGDTYTSGTNVQISEIDPTKLNGVDSNSDGKIDQGAYTIQGQAKDLAKVYIADLVTVYRDGTEPNDAAGKYGQEVDIKFRSLSAKARIGIYETVPGYSVKNVVFYTDASTPANDGKAYLFTDGTGNNKFNNEGTYIVYFPTTGKSNVTNSDYNKAHLAFSPAASNATSNSMDFGELDATNKYVAKENQETSSNDKLYIGRTSYEATYAGVNTDEGKENYYTTVIPNEEGAELNLKVNYQLFSTDGSEETINVTGASAKVPSIYAQWKSGYAYTYLFKISQNTNGLTNPSINKTGLYPITLDAVVIATTDSIQETITTVSDTCITTYSKGQIVTVDNTYEYKTGSNIYVIVEKAPALTNAKLYTVTIEDGAAQTINEASVANALTNGKQDPTGTWTVTDKNEKKMVVTETSGLLNPVTSIPAADAPGGNNIIVNGAVFKPTTAGTYAFEYTDKNNIKHYKIIIVKAASNP